jgi:hypothetical protein
MGRGFFRRKMDDLRNQILSRYEASDNYLETKRGYWDEYEDLFHNILSDNITANTKSQMFDPVLATMAIERSSRVMAQLPIGKVRGMSKNDALTEKLMNLTLRNTLSPMLSPSLISLLR